MSSTHPPQRKAIASGTDRVILPDELVLHVLVILLGKSWYIQRRHCPASTPQHLRFFPEEPERRDEAGSVYKLAVYPNPEPDAWTSLLKATAVFGLRVTELDLREAPGIAVPAITYLRDLTVLRIYGVPPPVIEIPDSDSDDDEEVIVADPPRSGYDFLPALRGLVELRTLQIRSAYSAPPDALKRVLEPLQYLKTLSLMDVPEAFHCIPDIRDKLTNLTVLDIKSCRLTDESIAPLRGWSRLQHLHLDGNIAITFDAVRELIASGTKPEILGVYGTGVKACHKDELFKEYGDKNVYISCEPE